LFQDDDCGKHPSGILYSKTSLVSGSEWAGGHTLVGGSVVRRNQEALARQAKGRMKACIRHLAATPQPFSAVVSTLTRRNAITP